MGKLDRYSFLLNNLAIGAAKSELYSRVLNGLESDETFAGKYFGTPMWDNLILDTEDKKLRIDMVLISISRSKRIIKTGITNVEGTRKESISKGDWIINIKGGLFGDINTNSYPEDDVAKLIAIEDKDETIRVECGFLNRFKIDDIVIEKIKFEAVKASRNVQFFDISAVSDTPQELIFRLQ